MAYKITTSVKLKDKTTGEYVPSNGYIVKCSARNFSQDISDKSITISPGYNLIVIEALSDYCGQIDSVIDAYIDPSKAKVDAIKDQTYTGESIVPGISLKLNNESILQSYQAKTIYFPNEDEYIIKKEFPEYRCYTLEYSNNKDVGTAHVHISPTHIGDGVLPKDIYFQIIPYTITGSKVSTTGIQTIAYYKGTTVEQDSMIVKFNGKTLIKGNDYTVQYYGNDVLGHASFDIIGKGNFNGKISKTFDIYGAINDATIAAIPDFEYDGTILKPSLNVTWYGYSLNEGVDYSIEYPSGSNFTLPGTKTGRINGIESAWMKQSKDFTYLIFGNIDQIQFFGPKKSYKRTGQQIKPEINVIFHGMLLNQASDYDISYPSIDYSTTGEKTIQIVGKNSYKGAKSFTYYIYDSEQNTIAYKKDGTSFIITANNLTRASFGIVGKKDTTLTRVVFGSNVTSLEKELFAHCTQLKNVNMRSCNSSIELPEGMFDGCIRLQNVIFPQQEYAQDYTQCIYAKGNGGFIDTGYIASKDTVIEFVFQISKNYSSSTTYIGFNAIDIDAKIRGNYRFCASSYGASLQIANHIWSWTGSLAQNTDYTVKISYSGGLYINGIQRGNTWHDATIADVILKHPICIFGQENDIVDFILKSFKITEGSTTIMNLVPAVDYDNIGCLVDLMTNTKHYSENGIDIDCFNSIPTTTTTYEVEFDANEGEIVGKSIKLVESGNALGDIPNATRLGYEFDGFINSTTGDKATPTTTITQDTLFIAWWKPVTTVKYATGEVRSFNLTGALTKKQIDDSDNVTELSIGSDIQSLGNSAFAHCGQLKRVVMLDNITTIPKEAFYNCGNLSSIVFSNNITSIGNSAFRYCYNLSGIELQRLITTIDAYAFANCTQLSGIDLSKLYNLRSINGNVFINCVKLSSINLPNSLTSIGVYAFSGTGLISVHIPPQLKSIANDGFYNCTNLTGVYVDDPTTLAGIQFENNFANPLRYAHDLYSTNGNLVTSLTFNDIPTIKQYSYSYCSSLQKIYVTGFPSTIDIGAFAYCDHLQDAFLTSIQSIGNYAFNKCTSLSNVEFRTDLLTIGLSAFAFTKIEDVNINSPNLASIDAFAFAQCSNLTAATFGDTLVDLNIGCGVFDKCKNLKTAYIGKGTSTIQTSRGIAINVGIFRGCNSLVSVVLPFVGAKPIGLGYDDGFGYVFGRWTYDGSQSVTHKGYTYFIPQTLRDVAILGNGSYTVPQRAFDGVNMISSISFRNGVEALDKYVAGNSENLQRITLASSVNRFDIYSFVKPQPALTCIAFEGRTIDDVKAIENYPFNIENESIISCELTN